MEILIFCGVVGAIVILLMMSRVGTDPTPKTDRQLQKELALVDNAMKYAEMASPKMSELLDKRKGITDELDRRGVSHFPEMDEFRKSR